MQFIRFQEQNPPAFRGLVLVYDLEGFSSFFNQPDVAQYVRIYLNHINEAIAAVIEGGDLYWDREADDTAPAVALLEPVHLKFMGDGGLVVWKLPENPDPGRILQIELCNRLWNLKKNFLNVLDRIGKDVPIANIPLKIRFGIAGGTVLPLKRLDTDDTEYIGFCLNLASRLQKYCPELGFIASARIDLPAALINGHQYLKVVAIGIRSFPEELVIVDAREYEALDSTIKAKLFRTVEAHGLA